MEVSLTSFYPGPPASTLPKTSILQNNLLVRMFPAVVPLEESPFTADITARNSTANPLSGRHNRHAPGPGI